MKYKLKPKVKDYIKIYYTADEFPEVVARIEEIATDEFEGGFHCVSCEAYTLFREDFDEYEEDEVCDEGYDNVNRPKHYVEQSAMIEPIEVLRYAPFDLGNALKYMIRAGHKNDELEDLKKARWYLECAADTWETHSDLYEDFFANYGRILAKFDGIPKNLMGCDSPIITLRDSVEYDIKEIENENQD